MKISIFTFTLGRDLYLERLLRSIARDESDTPVEHHLCMQGCKASKALKCVIDEVQSARYQLILHEWHENIGSALGMNRIRPELHGDLVVRMDDDSMIQSHEFMRHCIAIHEIIPEAIFSPFPVGLIANLGGTASGNRTTVYSEGMDMIYTLRKVGLTGGLTRIVPKRIFSEVQFADDRGISNSGNESSQLARHCAAAGVDMYYLENALIVEHQESTLGQRRRFSEVATQTVTPDRSITSYVREWIPPIMYTRLRFFKRGRI